MPTTIFDYRREQPPRSHSVLAIIAFAVSLHPLLLMVSRTRPFWDNHRLHPIASIVQAVPILVGPVMGFTLGIIAIVDVYKNNRRSYGVILAALAIAVSIFWVAALIYVLEALRAGGSWR